MTLEQSSLPALARPVFFRTFVLCYASSFLLVLFFALKRLAHWTSPDHWTDGSLLLFAGMGLGLLGILLGIVSVWQSRVLSLTERLLWTLGFVLFSQITGLVFMISLKKLMAAPAAAAQG